MEIIRRYITKSVHLDKQVQRDIAALGKTGWDVHNKIMNGGVIARYINLGDDKYIAYLIGLEVAFEFFTQHKHVKNTGDFDISEEAMYWAASPEVHPDAAGPQPNTTVQDPGMQDWHLGFVRATYSRVRLSGNSVAQATPLWTNVVETHTDAESKEIEHVYGALTDTVSMPPEDADRDVWRTTPYIGGTRNVGATSNYTTWFRYNDNYGVCVSSKSHPFAVYNQTDSFSRVALERGVIGELWSSNRIQDVGKDLGPILITPDYVRKSYPDYGSPYVWARSAGVNNDHIIVTNTQNRWAIYKNLDYVGLYGDTVAMNLPTSKYQLITPPYPSWVTLPELNDTRTGWYWRNSYNIDATRVVCIPAYRKSGKGLILTEFGALKDGALEYPITPPLNEISEGYSTSDSGIKFGAAYEDYPGLCEFSVGITPSATADPNNFSANIQLLRDECSREPDGRYFIAADYLAYDLPAKALMPKDGWYAPASEQYLSEKGWATNGASVVNLPQGTLISAHVEIRTHDDYAQRVDYNSRAVHLVSWRLDAQYCTRRGWDWTILYPDQPTIAAHAFAPYESWIVLTAHREGERLSEGLVVGLYLQSRTVASTHMLNGINTCGGLSEPCAAIVAPYNYSLGGYTEPNQILVPQASRVAIIGNLRFMQLQNLSIVIEYILNNDGENNNLTGQLLEVYNDNELVHDYAQNIYDAGGTYSGDEFFVKKEILRARVHEHRAEYSALLKPADTPYMPVLHAGSSVDTGGAWYDYSQPIHPNGHSMVHLYGMGGVNVVKMFGIAMPDLDIVKMYNAAWESEWESKVLGDDPKHFGYGVDGVRWNEHVWKRDSYTQTYGWKSWGSFLGYGVWLDWWRPEDN